MTNKDQYNHNQKFIASISSKFLHLMVIIGKS